jgi:hypothetical protein
MTKNQLKNVLKKIGETANKLFKRDGKITPVLFIYYIFENEAGKDEGSCTVLPILKKEGREKLMQEVGQGFLKNSAYKKVTAIAFISEAWMSVQESKNKTTKNIPPRKDPGRKEIVNISGMTDARESAMLVFEVRDRKDPEKRMLKFLKEESNMERIENKLLDKFWEGMGMAISKDQLQNLDKF